MAFEPRQIALLIAEQLRAYATEQGNVPFDRGDLRKAHVVEPWGTAGAILAANTPYARRVHDGSAELVIRPKAKKALSWPGAAHPVKQVVQPARKGNPWLTRAVERMERDNLDFLKPQLGEAVADELARAIRRGGLTVSAT